MTINLVIAVAKRVPVIRNQRRRHGWIAEVSVAAGIRRCSLSNVTLCCFEAVMITLLCDISRWGRWRRWIVRRRLWVRTSSECEGKHQCCNREQFPHDGSSFY